MCLGAIMGVVTTDAIVVVPVAMAMIIMATVQMTVVGTTSNCYLL